MHVPLCLLPTTSSSGDQPLMLNQASVYCCRSSLSVAVTMTREEAVVPSSTVTLDMEVQGWTGGGVHSTVRAVYSAGCVFTTMHVCAYGMLD